MDKKRRARALMNIQYFDTTRPLEEIKKDYKQLALKHHPDIEGGSNEAMQQINGEFKYIVQNYQRLIDTTNGKTYVFRGGYRYNAPSSYSPPTDKEFEDMINSIFSDLKMKSPLSEKLILSIAKFAFEMLIYKPSRGRRRRSRRSPRWRRK